VARVEKKVGISFRTTCCLLQTGRASVAIHRLVRSYICMPDGQEPAGKVQLDRDQLFARDRFSTDRVSYVSMYLPIPR